MAVIRQEKVDAVSDIKSRVDSSEVVFFANFRGLTVSEVTELRKQLRDAQSDAVVCKNTLARIALNELSIEYPEEFLVGPSMVIGTDADMAQASKILVKFAKDNEAFQIKGGILAQNKILTEDDINALSKLPSREELLAKLVGTMKAPISNFHSAISGPLRGFVYAVKALQEKNQEV